MNCKICSSIYLDEVNSLLKKGESSRNVSKYLKNKYNFRVTHVTVNNHKKNHLVPLFQSTGIMKLLYETGNYRLAKKIEKTEKIIKQYRKCECTPFMDRPVKKRGLVFLCSICNGWIRGDVGRSIRKDQKQKRRQERESEVLGFVVRKRGRFY